MVIEISRFSISWVIVVKDFFPIVTDTYKISMALQKVVHHILFLVPVLNKTAPKPRQFSSEMIYWLPHC